MGKAAVAIELTADERRRARGTAGSAATAQGLARRARIVLPAAEGLENPDICSELDVDANTVSKWHRWFAECRIDGLLDEPRPGGKSTPPTRLAAAAMKAALSSVMPLQAAPQSLR